MLVDIKIIDTSFVNGNFHREPEPLYKCISPSGAVYDVMDEYSEVFYLTDDQLDQAEKDGYTIE